MLSKAPQILGLSTAELLKADQNDHFSPLQLRSNRSYAQILRTNIFNTYNVILVVSAILVLLFGGSKDVLVALSLVIANIGVGLVQEIRAKKTLDKLATLSQRHVHVRRNGLTQEITLPEIIKGDVLEISPGTPIVVDGPLLYSESLEIDEASLSGESESVPKLVGDQLTSGSYGLAGFGLMRAEKVGKASSLYQLTQKAKQFRSSQTLFEKWLKKLFQLLLLTILLLAPLTFISGLNQGFTFSQTLTNVVNLTSSLIPQGMIMSMTILFAYGVIKMSTYQTLVQRLNSIALMGNITVLCADKTGTLTTNHLDLEQILPLGKYTNDGICRDLYAFSQHVSWANKTMQAIVAFIDGKSLASSTRSEKMFEVPFSSERKWGGITFHDQTLILGAPEILFTSGEVLDQARQLATQGLRVLVFVQSQEQLAEDGADIPDNLQPMALLAFREHLRTDVKETMAALAAQHIRLKIISGDSPETLKSIAAQVGLEAGTICSQEMLEKASTDSFANLVKTQQYFARIAPTMKEKIISELVRQGEIVAMIGDGVNDVRALKKSHIAIAVNDGAQITKDVSDLILLNNAFTVLPKAINEGRDITQRIYAVAKIFFVKVVYLVTLFLLAGFASFAFPISLRQTTWLGFIVVGVPTALIAFKILHPSQTKNVQKGLIVYTLTAGVIGGIFMALITVIVQLILHEDVELSRTQVALFASLYSSFILLQVHGINLFSLQSIRRNFGSFLIIMAIAVIAVLLPSQWAPELFRSAHLDYADWLILAFGIAGSVVFLRFILKKIHPLQAFRQMISD